MTQLNDYELKWLAIKHLGAKATAYVKFLDTTDFSVDTDANTETTMTPYDAKLFLLLAAADFGGRPH